MMSNLIVEPAATDLFLGRQPVLDRQQNLFGYELLFRSSAENRANVEDHDSATATVISHAFGDLGIEAVLGKHPAFINVSGPLIMSDLVEILPPERSILEILEDVEVTDGLAARCRELKQAGFRIALDDFAGEDDRLRPLLGVLDIVKIDLHSTAPDLVDRILRELRGSGITPLAEKVDERTQVDRCLALGFDLFQGYYFARPVVITGKRLSPAETSLMRLLALVLSDAENGEIEALFKQNPDLSVSLMRVVNSVAAGAKSTITSVRNALVVLGRRQLQRWLQLLLFVTRQGPGTVFPSPLLLLAATRGKLMELLAEGLRSPERELPEHAFMTGILSLVDVLFGMTTEEILASLPAPTDVQRALLRREGHLGALLALVETLERARSASLDSGLPVVPGLDRASVMRCQLEAMRWTNSLCETI
jgi:EAL and modified HD-GYP domain-containing signal transduction protein